MSGSGQVSHLSQGPGQATPAQETCDDRSLYVGSRPSNMADSQQWHATCIGISNIITLESLLYLFTRPVKSLDTLSFFGQQIYEETHTVLSPCSNNALRYYLI